MKKFINILAIIYISLNMQICNIFASSLDKNILPKEKFEVTSGVNEKNQKDIEVTFDVSRTIAGVAEENTEIIVTVSKEKVRNEKTDKKHEVTVGKSGIFSIKIDLLLGKNYIFVDAKNKDLTKSLEIVVNRKKQDIKNDLLDNNIALPGQTNNTNLNAQVKR